MSDRPNRTLGSATRCDMKTKPRMPRSVKPNAIHASAVIYFICFKTGSPAICPFHRYQKGPEHGRELRGQTPTLLNGF